MIFIEKIYSVNFHNLLLFCVNMSIWNKQDWIKDILSKSGTEITEIKDEEDNKGFDYFCLDIFFFKFP